VSYAQKINQYSEQVNELCNNNELLTANNQDLLKKVNNLEIDKKNLQKKIDAHEVNKALKKENKILKIKTKFLKTDHQRLQEKVNTLETNVEIIKDEFLNLRVLWHENENKTKSKQHRMLMRTVAIKFINVAVQFVFGGTNILYYAKYINDYIM
jgi:predicted nuclease with TOPRIM domain